MPGKAGHRLVSDLGGVVVHLLAELAALAGVTAFVALMAWLLLLL